MLKNMPAMQEIHVWSLGWEDCLEKGMETHFITFAWRIPWTEESWRPTVYGITKSSIQLSKWHYLHYLNLKLRWVIEKKLRTAFINCTLYFSIKCLNLLTISMYSFCIKKKKERDKEGDYIMIKGSIQEEDIYICTQHRSTAICKANANEYERGN